MDDTTELSTAATVAQDGSIFVMAATVSAIEGRRADVFGPGRFTRKASWFDWVLGTAMDQSTGYDVSSSKEEDRHRAISTVVRATGVGHRLAKMRGLPNAEHTEMS